MKKKIIIVAGDPNSINSEIIYKIWKKVNTDLKKKIYVIGNYNLIKEQLKVLNYKIDLLIVKNLNSFSNSSNLKIINVDLKYKNCFNVERKMASKLVLNSLNLAHKLALRKNVLGIVNCPINKQLLKKKNIGVTEYLATKCKINDGSEVMLIKSKHISVSPVTTHIDIKNISKKINSKLIIKKILTIESWLKKNHKKNSKIGVLGLNPHNSEFRAGSEEKRFIIPAILKLQKLGVNVTGPLVADTVFINDFKNYDIIVGMYHDQILSPFKAIYKFDAINITLGLKYLRLSPDHGVGLDLIGKNKANSSSLLNCINFLNKY